MSVKSVRIEGRLYLSIEILAELYEVQSVLLRKAYKSGLLGTGVEHECTLCIEAVKLDRVATIVRLHESFGLDLEAITKRFA